ncbi:MAG: cob(I)yrinic acid a,c-diamide adenosyltransferase [Bacteroidales bacterium]|nr:cob(I)yrinic acid a,c-diamide adenosyltransferase [Bacteroidales bacterium]
MNIYTRTGDDGTTSLIGGIRVPKYHTQIEAYGTVDELIANIAFLRDQDIQPGYKEELLFILERLMACASILASDCENCKDKIPYLHDNDITFLEQKIDKMEKDLPKLNSFILPGGHPFSSQCHICRCVCRRAERNAQKVHESIFSIPLVTKFLNRLSDYLFVLARKLGKDFNANEILWKPNLEK